jgi:hypothetical protein
MELVVLGLSSLIFLINELFIDLPVTPYVKLSKEIFKLFLVLISSI